MPFVGTLDEVVEDIATASALGADEVIIDLNLQKSFTDTGRMLDTGVVRPLAAPQPSRLQNIPDQRLEPR